MDTAYSLIEGWKILEIIQDGNASSEDIMLYLSRHVKDVFDYPENSTGYSQHKMDFYGKVYQITDIEKATVIYNKINNGEEVDRQALDY
ncbi:hypothetical protein ACIGEL_04305 [Rossellomorea aquimaris]|uniref:hypothetical protein n=1 Tax=Rossellomorea aquimaris TaxID=189382 RepID=UPI0037C5DF74